MFVNLFNCNKNFFSVLAFCHCDKISQKINIKGRFYFGSLLKRFQFIVTWHLLFEPLQSISGKFVAESNNREGCRDLSNTCLRCIPIVAQLLPTQIHLPKFPLFPSSTTGWHSTLYHLSCKMQTTVLALIVFRAACITLFSGVTGKGQDCESLYFYVNVFNVVYH